MLPIYYTERTHTSQERKVSCSITQPLWLLGMVMSSSTVNLCSSDPLSAFLSCLRLISPLTDQLPFSLRLTGRFSRLLQCLFCAALSLSGVCPLNFSHLRNSKNLTSGYDDGSVDKGALVLWERLMTQVILPAPVRLLGSLSLLETP